MGVSPAQRMVELAAQWGEANPQLRRRLQRTLALVGECTPLGGKDWLVEGVEGDYLVTVDPISKQSTCSCPDSEDRGNHCKHRLAVALVYKVEQEDIGRVLAKVRIGPPLEFKGLCHCEGDPDCPICCYGVLK